MLFFSRFMSRLNSLPGKVYISVTYLGDRYIVSLNVRNE